MFNVKNQVSRGISSFLLAGLVLLGSACALEETGSQENPYAEPAVGSVPEGGPQESGLQESGLQESGLQQDISTEDSVLPGCWGFFECPTTGNIFVYTSGSTLQQAKVKCAAACSVACIQDSDCF